MSLLVYFDLASKIDDSIKLRFRGNPSATKSGIVEAIYWSSFVSLNSLIFLSFASIFLIWLAAWTREFSISIFEKNVLVDGILLLLLLTFDKRDLRVLSNVSLSRP